MARRISYYYLFSGYLELDSDNQIVPIDGALDTLREITIFSSDNRVDKKRKWLAYRTNKNGVINSLSPPFDTIKSPIFSINKKPVFHFLPPDLLLYSWAAKGKTWAAHLSDFISKQGKDGVSLKRIVANKKHMRMPEANPKTETEKAYLQWYNKLTSTEPLHGFVLAKTRAIYLLFSHEAFLDANVIITTPGNNKSSMQITTRRENNDNTVYALAATNNPKRFPAGIYTFKIKDFQISDEAITDAYNSKTGYTLKEKVRFSIKCPAGEFDFINADPISIEESMMVQFPIHYSHLIQAAKESEIYPKGSKPAADAAKVPSPLKAWQNRLSWTYDKAKLSVGLINADTTSKRAYSVGPAIYNSIKGQTELDSLLKFSVDLCFGISPAVSDWKDMITQLSAVDDLQNVKKAIWETADGHWQKNKWWAHVQKIYKSEEELSGVQLKLLEIDKLPEFERKNLLASAVPEKQTKLQKLIGDGTGQKIQKSIVLVDTAISIYQAGSKVNQVEGTRENLENNKKLFTRFTNDYKEMIGEVPCREAIGNLEKARAATVSGHMKMDKEMVEALDKSIDAALGVLALVPATSLPAGMLLLVKSTGQLAKDILCTAAGWIDHFAIKGFFSELVRVKGMLSKVQGAACANQSLMPSDIGPEGGKDNLELQFRLRAEALYGLMALIVRAGLASSNDAEFKDKIDQYKVKEYIETCILRDNWEIPGRPAVALTMDSYWLIARNQYGYFKDYDTYKEKFGHTRPLPADKTAKIKESMIYLGVTDSVFKDYVKANFQMYFPIHKMDADSVYDFARTLDVTHTSLDNDCIEYSIIYIKQQKKNSAASTWVPLNKHEKNHVHLLDEITPFTHIRILVVLKKDVAEGLYPISLQLIRTDGWNVNGPIYRGIIRKLQEDELISEEKQKFKGRLGCVIYPFYQLGIETIPGIKPMAHERSIWRGETYYKLYNLRNMTYMFKVKLGGEAYKELKLGPRSTDKCIITEFPMSVDIERNKNEEKLLVIDFLKRDTTMASYPQLVDGDTYGAGVFYVKAGNKPYVSHGSEMERYLKIDGFNWGDRVDLIVTAHIKKGDNCFFKEDYEKQGMRWNSLPFLLQLINYEGLDRRGPEWPVQMNLVAECPLPRGSLKKVDSIKDKVLDDWITGVIADKGKKKMLCDSINSDAKGLFDEFFVYAGHLSFKYSTPKNKDVNGLRPFASKLIGPGEYFRYGFILTSAKGIGFSSKNSKGPLFDLELHLKPPEDYYSNVPWADMKKKEIEEWITEKNPRITADSKLIK